MIRLVIGKTRLVLTGVSVLMGTTILVAQDSQAQGQRASMSSRQSAVSADVFGPFQWRSIGPNSGGRSIAVAGSQRRPYEYYFGATGGGLWKTTNGGTDWYPVTDGQINTASVGAVAVCEADPDIVYLGTGEAHLRGTISMGDGVYRSTDGGKTWTYLGLESSTGQQAVARVRIDPNDCDLVYAAVLGDPWGPNHERGVFRSRDGGLTWENVLYRDEQTGAADLVLDPSNARTMYATLWQVRRRPWEANSGGPGSGLFKSTDGGSTWEELTKNPGLPTGRLGKMGVAVSGADRNRVYALIEHDHGGVFRSDDGGATWQLVNGNRVLYGRAEYYVTIYADPQDRDKVYVPGGNGFFRSLDGGRTYTTIAVPHGDNHDMWIDPSNPQRMIQSNDGGANVSVDGGETWTAQDYPTSQMYHVITTNDFPYYVCGGQQDRSSKCVPSDGDGSYWYDAAAGEQGYIAVHPLNTFLQYGGAQRGYLWRYDRATGQRRSIDVWPDHAQGLPPNVLRERFQWTFPIIMSPHEPNVVYVTSQHVWRTTNGGHSWERISPDLTYADPATLNGEQSIVPNQNSQDYYATIFSLALSPHDPGTIWTGSDDGLVHVTRNGGAHWENVTPPDLPKFSRVSLIEVSPHSPGKAYLAVERYKMQDLAPYIFKTEDFGKSWTKITNGISQGHYVRAVKEDTERAGLLFVGTEHAPYISLDDGANWQSLALNLPDVQVSDLEVKDNDLVIATYGRGFYILDDISSLRQLTPEVLGRPVHLFKPADAIQTRARPTQVYRRTVFTGSNRVNVDYRLQRPARQVTLEFIDNRGETIRSFVGAPGEVGRPVLRNDVGRWVNGPGSGWSSPPPVVEVEAGLHRFSWDMRYPPAAEFEGMIVRGGNVSGPLVPPGEYTVRLTVDGDPQTHAFRVQPDSRLVDVTQADLDAQFQLAMRIHRRLDDATSAVARIRDVKRQIDDRIGQTDDRRVAQSGRRLQQSLSNIEGEIYQVQMRSPSAALQYGIKITNKLAFLKRIVESADSRPTEQSYGVLNHLSAQLDELLAGLDEVLGDELAQFNGRLQDRGLTPVHTAGSRSD